ncbi:MAG: universal stress protein [Acidimicrobiia bacterium]|nr:universal stress protein [Acidimicrobiia bacterium]MBT8193304.1 universal stress protein [Acidimicrobiia bacterium]NNF89272.1 universal stress protein [Acidimicrobiia bacterium]RZV43303.1 MAG: universal stress protein [Acidimicrobiia bacterium]
MAFKTILIAVDGSPGAQSATRIGGEMTQGRDAQVLLVHAAPLPPLVPGQPLSQESLANMEEMADAAFSAAEEILTDLKVKAERVVLAGAPADVILSVAEDRSADVIVVGHRGFGAMKRFVLGSVSSKLAHQARCALLLAPVPED